MKSLIQATIVASLLMLYVNACSIQPKVIEWSTNYTVITELASIEKKPVLLFFHGSDWCPPCILMQREVFDNQEFIDFASDKILFLDVDFPSRNKLSDAQLKHNNELKRQFGIDEDFSQGYPQVVIIDTAGKVYYQEKGYSGDGPQMLMDKITSAIDEMK